MGLGLRCDIIGQVRGAKPTVLGLVPLSQVMSEGVGLTLIGLVLGNHSPQYLPEAPDLGPGKGGPQAVGGAAGGSSSVRRPALPQAGSPLCHLAGLSSPSFSGSSRHN